MLPSFLLSLSPLPPAVGVASSTIMSEQGSGSPLALVGGATSPSLPPLHCTWGVASSLSTTASFGAQRSSSGVDVHPGIFHLSASVSHTTSVTLISLYRRVSFDPLQAREPRGVREITGDESSGRPVLPLHLPLPR